MCQQVLNYWFNEIEPEKWFKKDEHFDRELTERFADLLKQAAACELYTWRQTIRGRLAEIIVLDQFSRNIYRDTPQAFSQDTMALTLAQEAIALGALEQLHDINERKFLLMPFMHSESKAIHQLAEPLFAEHTNEQNLEYEIRHKEIIDRFGRYPHRNEVLQRVSTEEERHFLTQPNSSF